ncbi:hypothetical protein CCP3SC1AL1_990003 [Gammaproteobacteria bacterium]
MKSIIMFRLALIYFIFILGLSIIVEWLVMTLHKPLHVATTQSSLVGINKKMLEYKIDKLLEDAKQEIKREYMNKIYSDVEHFSEYALPPPPSIIEKSVSDTDLGIEADKKALEQLPYHSSGRVPFTNPDFPMKTLTDPLDNVVNSQTLYKRYKEITKPINWQEQYDIIDEVTPKQLQQVSTSDGYTVGNRYEYTAGVGASGNVGSLRSGKAPDSFFQVSNNEAMPSMESLEQRYDPKNYKVQPIDAHSNSHISYIKYGAAPVLSSK